MLFGASARAAVLLAVLTIVGGCAAGYRTTTTNGHEKVYKVDDDGNKNLIYEVAKDGTLTVHDDTDPRARQMLAAKEQQDERQALEEERIAKIRKAPKRAANDPIRVILHAMEVEEKLRQAQHTEGAIEEQFRAEFADDGIIRVVEPVASQKTELAQVLEALTGQAPTEAPGGGPAADVEVTTRAWVEEKAGYDQKTKKLGTMAALVYEATIKSNYLPEVYTVKEEGNVFRNADVTKRFAEKVKKVIKNKVGPTIPADRDL